MTDPTTEHRSPNAPLKSTRLAMRERPNRRPVMSQNWRDLLFLHWRYSAEEIQRTLPKGLTVDTFDGTAWLGIVPFFMCDVRLKYLPPIPGTANFQELNVRTYVYDKHGTPGVWFYSLDANCLPAVKAAQWWFRLPYNWAKMSASIDSESQQIDYHSRRRGTDDGASSRYLYEPQGDTQYAEPETLEFFLLERYILFAETRPGRLSTGQVYHSPYPFQSAEVPMWDNIPICQAGFDVGSADPVHVAYSPGVNVEIFGLERVKTR